MKTPRIKTPDPKEAAAKEEEEAANMEKQKEYGVSAKKPMQELKESIGRDKEYYLGGEDPMDELIVKLSIGAERDHQRAFQPYSRPKPKKKRTKDWRVTKYLEDKDISIFEALPAEIIVQIMEVFYTDHEIMKKSPPPPPITKKKRPNANPHVVYVYDPIECLQRFSLVSKKGCAAATRVMFRNLTLKNMHSRAKDQDIDEYVASICQPRILSSGRKLSLILSCYRCTKQHRRTVYHDLWDFLHKVAPVFDALDHVASHITFDFSCTCMYGGMTGTDLAQLQRETGLAMFFALMDSFDFPRCEALKLTIRQRKKLRYPKDQDSSTFWKNMNQIKRKDMAIFIDMPGELELQTLADMADTEHLCISEIPHRRSGRVDELDPTMLQLTPSNAGSAIRSLALNRSEVSSKELVNFLDSVPSVRDLEITQCRMNLSPRTWINVFEKIGERTWPWERLKVDDLSTKVEEFWRHSAWNDTRKLKEAEQKAMMEMFRKVEGTAVSNGAIPGEYFFEVYVFWSERTRWEAERTRLTGFGGCFDVNTSI